MNFGCVIFALLFIESVHSAAVSSADQHSELASLKQELNNLKASMAAMNSTLLTLNNAKPLTAFTACMGSYPPVLGPQQPIEFNQVFLNEGGAYEPRQGMFQAPVSGVYQFIMTYLSDGTHEAYIEMVKDGEQVAFSWGNSHDFNTGILQVNIKVDAGQHVWCRNAHPHSNSYLHGNGKHACFSGHIIA